MWKPKFQKKSNVIITRMEMTEDKEEILEIKGEGENTFDKDLSEKPNTTLTYSKKPYQITSF